MEGALRLRKVAADFGDDLRQEDIKKLMFLRDIPQGIQERLTNAVEVFQHLEETAKLNFRDPQAIIDVMREMKKEKWALDTEKQFGIRQQQSDGILSVVHRPEQEFEIILESDSQVVRREHPSTATKLSNSLNRHMKLHEGQSFSPIDELCCNRDSVCSTQQVSCSGHCQNTSNINDRIHESTPTFACRISSKFSHKKLTRNSSCASKRSSGYASGVSETDFYGEDNDEMSEDEEEYCRKHQHHFQTLSPINSRSSTLGSKTSSYDGYATANEDEDEGISGQSKELANIPLLHSPKDSKTFQDYIMYSPPYNGVQVLEGDMIVHVKELQKAVEKSSFGHCTQSIPFPSFSTDQGVQFQIHLYPVGLGSLSSPSCAVYLVILGWSPDRRVPLLPKFEININVSAIQQTSMSSKGKNVTIANERTEVDVMKDILPPTPSNVDYTNIALFPILFPHTELSQLESKSIVIKASLTYKPIVPCCPS